ncbi:hypothetical protein, partial [Corynebacterium striatum]
KPDGRVLGALPKLLTYMRDNGFVPFYYVEESMTFSEAREIWKFQWNIATIDRAAIFEELLGLGKQLTIFFYDMSRLPGDIPATVRLRTLKGSALKEYRDGSTLRDRIEAPNRVLTLIHAPDEPIDILRELGIRSPAKNLYFRLQSLFESALQTVGGTRNVEENLLQIAQEDLVQYENWSKSLQEPRIQAVVSQLKLEIDNLDDSALKKIDDGALLRYFNRFFGTSQKDFEVWDMLFTASFLVSHDLPGVCRIDEDGVSGWKNGAGLCL